MWLSRDQSRTKQASTVSNWLLETWPKQACVPPKRPEQISTLSMQREWKKGTTTKKDTKTILTKQKSKREKNKDKDKENKFEVGKYREGSKKGRENTWLKWEKREWRIACATRQCVTSRDKWVKKLLPNKKTPHKSHTTSCVCSTTYTSKFSLLDGSPENRKTNARVQVVRPTTLGLLHKFDGFPMNTHAGRMGGEYHKHLHLQIRCQPFPLQKAKTTELQKCFLQNCTPIGFR